MNQKKNLIGAGTIAIVAFLMLAWLWPSWQARGFLKETLAEREQMLTDRAEVIEKINTLSTEYQERENEIARFSLVIPQTKKSAELVSALEDMARRSGVSISSFKITDKAADASVPYQSISFEINISGSYSSLFAFLGNIERNIRLLDITSIQASANEGGSGLLTITLKGNGYFLQ